MHHQIRTFPYAALTDSSSRAEIRGNGRRWKVAALCMTVLSGISVTVAIAALLRPTQFILNVPQHPLPYIRVDPEPVRRTPTEAEYTEIAFKYLELLESYTPQSAEARLRRAADYVSADKRAEFHRTVVPARIAAIKKSGETRELTSVSEIEPIRSHLEAITERRIRAEIRISGTGLSRLETKTFIVKFAIGEPHPAISPSGLVVTEAREE